MHARRLGDAHSYHQQFAGDGQRSTYEARGCGIDLLRAIAYGASIVEATRLMCADGRMNVTVAFMGSCENGEGAGGTAEDARCCLT